jgi:hypothetical protein
VPRIDKPVDPKIIDELPKNSSISGELLLKTASR